MFHLFFRGSDELQRTCKGTGLGLYIVKTLVGMLKGRIFIHDGPDGEGSIFEVILPGRLMAQDRQQDAQPPTETAETVSAEV